MKVIELTDLNGNGIFINPKFIEFISVIEDESETGYYLRINFKSGTTVDVRETLTTVQDELEEYSRKTKKRCD